MREENFYLNDEAYHFHENRFSRLRNGCTGSTRSTIGTGLAARRGCTGILRGLPLQTIFRQLRRTAPDGCFKK
jgi:hypothetical protein